MLTSSTRSRFAALGLAAVAGSVAAQPAMIDDANVGQRYSVEIGVDYTTAYFLRGINKEDSGAIIQPYAELDIDLVEYDNGLALDAVLGTKNSIHSSNNTARDGDTTSSWYESDFHIGLTADYEQFEFGISYLWRTSPSSAFSTVEELILSVEYDDSDFGFYSDQGFEGFALNPTAKIVFELDNTSFGDEEGVYLELGVAPDYELITEGDFAGTTVAFPVTLGLSLGDYYDDGTDDDTLGYVAFGPVVEAPLPIEAEWGNWTASAGLTILVLGDALESANEGDSTEFIGTIGVGLSF